MRAKPASLESQFGGLIGPGGARTVRDMVSNGQHGSRGIVGIVLGAAGLILGATGAFLALQEALNVVWAVGPDPKQGGVRQFIAKRLLSLGMVMGLGFLLVVSLALTAGLSALGGMVGNGTAVGLAAGFMVLSTQKEGELVGEARDNLVGKARELVHEKTEQIQHVAQRVVSEVRSTSTEAARQEGLTG